MASLNISMPDDMRRFVDERTTQGGFSTPTEYVRSLIRADRQRAQQQRLESLLLEGLESGRAEGLTDEDWARVRRLAGERLNEKTDS